jgi:thiamine biosynthesis lipoprotein
MSGSASGDDYLLVKRGGRPMATDVSVAISAPREQAEAASVAADACMDWFDEVDACLSRFRPDSELSRLNRATNHWFAASALLYGAVTVAIQSAHASAGRFDPTLLRRIQALGYDRDFDEIAQREIAPVSGTAPPAPVGPREWRAIELDPVRRRIRLPEHVQLDLGGIAKGWSADVALHRFCLPFSGALINVGGDLRAYGGPAPGEGWSVGIRDPRRELAAGEGSSPGADHVAILTFSRGGLATSGAVRRWWLRDGKRAHHLLDPRTGNPIELWIDQDTVPNTPESAPLIATATALAPTAARAEVAAKVALLRGYPQALRLVEKAWERPISLSTPQDADVAVALVLTFGTGEIAMSGNLPAYLATWGTQGVALPASPQFTDGSLA